MEYNEKKLSFIDAIKELMGFKIDVFLKDGELVKGLLAHSEVDFLVLEKAEDQSHYVKFEQILAVSKNTRDYQPQDSTVEFNQGESLNDILAECQYQWITLKCGTDTFEGILSRSHDEHLVLLSKEDSILINKSHISQLYIGELKEEKQQEKEVQEKQEEKNETSKEVKQEKGEKKSSQEIIDVAPLPPLNLNQHQKSTAESAVKDTNSPIQTVEDFEPFVMESNIQRRKKKQKNLALFEESMQSSKTDENEPVNPEASETLDTPAVPEARVESSSDLQLENQYYSLMKHAEKMYLQLKEKRLQREQEG
ncbi:hypothetical protein [Falsibacillus pallidus]|uniref:Spore coat protein B n=1 Tax=Falsibacillus pallidus TaxID=493781 RepID=A0A370GI42_9BACI|nr:hypothetical protein [Falsibacillus pallidus]RDI41593.1 hypothetical protein DFR59_10746 [Falsibacillus pallidus]